MSVEFSMDGRSTLFQKMSKTSLDISMILQPLTLCLWIILGNVIYRSSVREADDMCPTHA